MLRTRVCCTAPVWDKQQTPNITLLSVSLPAARLLRDRQTNVKQHVQMCGLHVCCATNNKHHDHVSADWLLYETNNKHHVYNCVSVQPRLFGGINVKHHIYGELVFAARLLCETSSKHQTSPLCLLHDFCVRQAANIKHYLCVCCTIVVWVKQQTSNITSVVGARLLCETNSKIKHSLCVCCTIVVWDKQQTLCL